MSEIKDSTVIAGNGNTVASGASSSVVAKGNKVITKFCFSSGFVSGVFASLLASIIYGYLS